MAENRNETHLDHTTAGSRPSGCVSKLVSAFVCRALTFFERLPKCAIRHPGNFIHVAQGLIEKKSPIEDLYTNEFVH